MRAQPRCAHGTSFPAKPHRLGTSLGGFPLNEFVMSDSVGQYLNEIGAVALLNAQEERELSQIIEKGFEARARKEAGEKVVISTEQSATPPPRTGSSGPTCASS